MRLLTALLPLALLTGCPTTPKESAADDTGTGGDDTSASDGDGDGFAAAEDCDDTDPAVNPDAAEVCDGIDNDCSGDADVGATDASTFYMDADGDTYGDPDMTEAACAAPAGYVADSTDCEDSDPAINPGAADDTCDGTDQDCDGSVDEDSPDAVDWYADSDGDGFGAGAPARACDAPAGHVADSTDCDDAAAGTHPGADELCDAADNDCDAEVDEEAVDRGSWFLDGDQDGYGDPATLMLACDAPAGMVADSTDCDDGVAAVNPAATEVCNGADDDCSGDIDSDAVDALTWYADGDTDGYGDAAVTTVACVQPSGYVADSTDCDGNDGSAYPGATEVCDGVDNDCNGFSDEDTAVDALTWYLDSDSDGFGAAGTGHVSCLPPAGYVGDATDCDDSVAATYPGADEYCDGTDTDCNGTLDDDYAVDAPTWYADRDGDGYGALATGARSCAQPVGTVSDFTDCDDAAAAINPAADEYCDSVDNDCNGTDDDDYAVDAPTWYADRDGDGYGDPAAPDVACNAPAQHIADMSDCDDTAAAINPAAAEICNNLDDNCDAVTDTDAVDRDTWYLDGDGDNYGDSAVLSCTQPPGSSATGGDCDDASASVYPNAPEICENGVDDGCDGVDDCEIVGDALTTDADATIYGLAASDLVAQAGSVAGGDFNGDGYDDLLLGAEGYDSSAVATNRGRAYVLYGSAAGVGTSLASPGATFTGPVNGDGAGRAVSAMSDIDGDADEELIIGQYKADNGTALNSGIVSVLLGGNRSGDTGLIAANAQLLIKGGRMDDNAGSALSSGDIDDDGRGDVLIGAPGHDVSATISNGGRVALYSGSSPAGTYIIGVSQTALFSATGAAMNNAYLGSAVDGRGDFNGDGYDDVLAGAYGTTVSGSANTGTAYVFYGPQSSIVTVTNANVTFTGAAAGDELGFAVSYVGDVDDDGYQDLMIGAHKRDSGATDAGAALYYRGSAAHALTLSPTDAYATIQGAAASDFAGRQVAGAGDVDADGYADLLVSATGYDGAYTGNGLAALFYGPLPAGTWSILTADATWEGSRASEAAGSALGRVGDLDGDGSTEIAVGASGAQNAGVGTGAVYLIYGTRE